MRHVDPQGCAGPVTFVAEEPPQFTVRMKAETEAGQAHGEPRRRAARRDRPAGAAWARVEPIDDVAAEARRPRHSRRASCSWASSAPPNQQYIPWMQATYVMAAHKSALAHLPAGADVNALTYDQLTAWAKAVDREDGQARARLSGRAEGPDAPLLPGLLLSVLHRRRGLDLQVGGRGGRLGQAQGALAARRAPTPPATTSCRSRCSPARCWIAFDHIARLKDALAAQAERLRHLPGPRRPEGARLHAGGRRALDRQGRPQPGRSRGRRSSI